MYPEVRGLRTVRFCCKVMCACFEEFFKTVEWQLVHPGRDEWHQIGGVAGQDDDSCEVSGQEDYPAGRECWRLLLTWQNKKWELSCDFLVQVIVISDQLDLYTFQCLALLRPLESPVWQMLIYFLSIYCGMGGRMLKPYCWHCEQYWYCVFHKVPLLGSSPSVRTTLHNTQRALCQILTGCTITLFRKKLHK